MPNRGTFGSDNPFGRNSSAPRHARALTGPGSNSPRACACVCVNVYVTLPIIDVHNESRCHFADNGRVIRRR